MDLKTAPPSQYEVTFSAPVYPTENPEKVKRGLLNLINYGRPKTDGLISEADILQTK
ncbi:hypothetical protein [Methanolapillus millepedarum]|uniref:hypothetical protein n=1 Tax=Methanolapillus millepedarum TaxID=3028296 RepID=UPI0030B89E6D